MRSVAFVPIKANSTRVPGKNLRSLGGTPLYRPLLTNVVLANSFDKIVVDTDSQEITEWCNQKGIDVIKRDPWYASDEANGNELLVYHSEIFPEYELYFQLFVTAPFLSSKTIEDCLSFLKSNRGYDSIFTAQKQTGWFWMDGNPVNYQPGLLPRSQDAKFLIQETTGLYGIRKQALQKYKQRIGLDPKYWIVDWKESIDIDDEEDFRFAELVCKMKDA